MRLGPSLPNIRVARIGVASSVGFLGAAIALFLLSVWFARGDAQENRYANYTEARESQRHGWLPATLPRSATEIHEWHDLDTNVCLGSFRFDPRERPAIEVTLNRGRRRTIRIDRDPSFSSPVPRDPGEQQLASAGFEFYSDRDFDFAINWKTGVAYFWNSSAQTAVLDRRAARSI
jgi:hypothetical protein